MGSGSQDVCTQDQPNELIELGFDHVYNTVDNRPWSMEKDLVLKQHDRYNCGPIACVNVTEIYGMLPQNSIKTIGHSVY